MKNTFKNKIIILFCSIFICFFLGELTIRTKDALNGSNFFSNEGRDKLAIKKNTIVPFRIFGPNYYTEKDGVKYISSTHKELYPFIKSKNTFRIVCFGGSTTDNPYAYKDYKIHYPLMLQRLLKESYPNKNIEVINVGSAAYSTAHLLIVLTLDVISWSPDLVIISENVNDLDVEYMADFHLDYSNKYKRLVPADYYKEYTVMNALFRWSSFYWFIKGKLEPGPTSNSVPEKEIVRIIDDNVPTEISQYVFRRNLLNFYYIANKWGIPVLYATQPMDSTTGNYDFLSMSEATKRYKATIKPHHKFFNNIIKEVAINTNSYFLDNDSLFGGESRYFIDEVHYSKSGIQKLAKNYYDYIISKNIIK